MHKLSVRPLRSKYCARHTRRPVLDMPATVPLPVHLVSGYEADPVRQHYDYAAQATDAFDRCIASQRRRGVDAVCQGAVGVSASHELPVVATAVRGGWKKLHAIANASLAAGRDGLVVWHDADAVPTLGGQLVERVRRAAASQPDVAVWLQPGWQLTSALTGSGATPRRAGAGLGAGSGLSRQLGSFEGVSLADVRHRVREANALQTGVLVVRAARAELVTGALEYYDAAAEARGTLRRHLRSRGVPEHFCHSQEQGPLAHHLLSTAPAAVRLVPWLQCEVRLLGADCRNWSRYVASFAHFSGCGFTTKNARKCVARFCRGGGGGGNEGINVSASWRRPARVQRGQWRGQVAAHGGELRAAALRKITRAPVRRRTTRAGLQASAPCTERPGCCARHPRACA